MTGFTTRSILCAPLSVHDQCLGTIEVVNKKGEEALFDDEVEDVALLLEVVAGKDPDDPRQQDVPIRPYTRALGEDVNGLRLGVLREGFGEGTEPDVEAAVRRAVSAFTNLGADAREVSVPVHGEALASSGLCKLKE